jgi:hypothetical protein
MSNDETVFELRFEGITLDEGNVLAKELQEEVLAAHKDANVRVTKDDESNQDFGATLVLVLGTPAVVIIARAIADYIHRRGVSVTITAEGGVSIKNLKSTDVANVVKNLPKKSK